MEDYKLLKDQKPRHKDLVLCWDGQHTMPSIYYNNQSFNGFYFFTTFYENSGETIYSKVRLKPKHQIKGIISWKLIEGPKNIET